MHFSLRISPCRMAWRLAKKMKEQKLIDSHAHLLDERFDEDRAQLIEDLSRQMEAVIECASAPEDFERILELTRRYPLIYGAVGVHPESVDSYTQQALERIEHLLEEPKILAIGEIGLDYYYDDNAPRETQRLIFEQQLALALLDVNLPDGSGFALCRELKAEKPELPVIFLTANDLEQDVLTGFDMGAEDYVTKPFSPAELTARVDALFRRAGGEETAQTGEISQPPFLLNVRNRTLEKNGQRIKLTQVEYSIMKVFMENPGKALSREEILDMVWGRDYFGELKIVDVNIRRLRLKIEDNVQNPTYITTVWGYGYKWGF